MSREMETWISLEEDGFLKKIMSRTKVIVVKIIESIY